MANPIKYFMENFGKVPEPRPPLIPARWRIPFFVAVAVVSFVALVVLINYVIVPAIQLQESPAPAPAASPEKQMEGSP